MNFIANLNVLHKALIQTHNCKNKRTLIIELHIDARPLRIELKII